jgi:GTP-binding protein LepA
VVDASQGIQAQTLANVYMAMEHDLTIIPVVNKIDLPNAEPARVAREMSSTLGFAEDDVLFASAKEGTGVRELLEAVVAASCRRAAPEGACAPSSSIRSTTPTRA